VQYEPSIVSFDFNELRCSACTMGKDRLGWGYAMQATDQINTLRLAQKRSTSKSSLPNDDYAKVMDRLELGSFIIMR
jgi:hypothetical protein